LQEDAERALTELSTKAFSKGHVLSMEFAKQKRKVDDKDEDDEQKEEHQRKKKAAVEKRQATKKDPLPVEYAHSL
jgi:hypothetical protein